MDIKFQILRDTPDFGTTKRMIKKGTLCHVVLEDEVDEPRLWTLWVCLESTRFKGTYALILKSDLKEIKE